MATIRPVSSSHRKTGEPIYLTKNGVEHLVLMDAGTFAELQKRDEKIGRDDG